MKNAYKIVLVTLSLVLPFQVASLNLLKANDDFKSKQYGAALIEYQQGANVGNVHAFYQLGVMYSRGLGVDADLTNSLLYFSLAAGQNHNQANEALDSLLSHLDAKQLAKVHVLLDDFKQEQYVLAQQYLPEIIEENLAYKVTFDGEPALEKKFYSQIVDDLIEMNPDSSLPIPPSPYLVVENDVARDGSIRNIKALQKSGQAGGYIDEYKLFPLARPEFKGLPAEFVTRTYLGLATGDIFALIDEQPRLYGHIRKIAVAAKEGGSLEEQYQYAISMIMFPYLEKQSNQAENLMKSLAIQGHPAAMYEYGFKLYSEQREISEAIKWITEASKYGLARAEYRLGKLLTSSPWVKSDEKKALFWFESAMEKAHDAATLYAAEIKLTSEDPALKDVEGAIKYLALAEESQRLNPEYFYLLALSYKDRPARNFKLAIANLERAIFMGSQANWDVTEWRDLLSRLTKGNVTILDS